MPIHLRGHDPSRAESLRAAGLDRPGHLLRGDLGTPVKTKPNFALFRLASPDGTRWYLKRTRSPGLRPALRAALRQLAGRGATHTEAYRVKLAADALTRAGVAVMPIDAWAERRWLGLAPIEGCVLAREVVGEAASNLYRSTDDAGRRALMHRVGRIMARLHAHGMHVELRMHDLIRPGPADTPVSPDDELVMIDLDFKGYIPRVQGPDWAEAARMLGRCVYVFVRKGHPLGDGIARAFLRGYRAELRALGVRAPRWFLGRARASLRERLEAHFADPERCRQFPDTPRMFGG